MNDFLKRELLKLAEHVSIATSKIHMPFSRKRINDEDFYKCVEGLQVGDILVSRVRGEFGNVLIPGFYSHVAIVIDNKYVIEATSHGVVKTTILGFFLGKDNIACLRPLFASNDDKKKATELALEQVGKPYNFSMDSSDAFYKKDDIKKFYCSQLVYWCFNKACETSPFQLRSRLGIMTVTPQDFVNATTKFSLTFISVEK